MQNDKVILYASYQKGPELPGYIRFALQHLSETPFRVVLLTNKRELSPDTLRFLEDHNIFLYLTENHGLDFGMWRRFLKDLANCKGNFTTLSGISRLVLMNDSVVYYRNRFQEFFDRAERSDADAISLTQSEEVRPHLQSYFLYLKPESLGAFYMHLLETPEQETFYDVFHRLEIGMASAFEDAEVRTEALYPTRGLQDIYSYPELIAAGAGFIKCKLLQRRFSLKEKVSFIKREAGDILNTDYHSLIIKSGTAPDFKEEWLPAPAGIIQQAADKLWEKPLEKLGIPLYKKIFAFKNSSKKT